MIGGIATFPVTRGSSSVRAATDMSERIANRHGTQEPLFGVPMFRKSNKPLESDREHGSIS